MKRIFGIGFLLSSIFLVGCSTTKQDETIIENIDQIAQCLGEKGVKMYGTETCSHCIDQKKLFGDSFKYINYVDCAKDTNACAKLEGTPTREFPGGELLAGKQMISTLAEKAGCNTK